jgi:broad specificity phosphatase PhoE
MLATFLLPKVPFYYMRHGQTIWNEQGRYMGISDIPLSEAGIRQVKKARLIVEKIGLRTICHSPLKRAKVTAEVLAEQSNITLVEIENLKECNWGILEGQEKGKTDLRTEWIHGKPISQAEDFDDFIARSMSGIVESLSYQGPVLIISHGGVYGAISKCLGKEPTTSSSIDYCKLLLHLPPSEERKNWEVSSVDAL